MTALKTLTIPKPDDWHVHLRDGAMLRAVLPHTAKQFARAIVMPNLKPPVTTTAMAASYRERICAALPEHLTFTPLMTAYLTEQTDPDDLARGYEEGILFAAKLYPAGTTTNSSDGVTDLQAISMVLDKLQRIGMPLLIHGEVNDPAIDFFDREAAFIDRFLIPLRRSFPDLKVVLEHITTKHAAQYIAAESQNGKLAATITPHHMLLNRNALFDKGIQPHHFCLPILKSEADRLAIVQAATSGAPMFFAGTDSAPHPKASKESAQGPGGIFSAPNAVALYAEIFDEAEALDRLENFLCFNGPAFHGIPANAGALTLEKREPTPCPTQTIVNDGGETIVVFPSQKPLSWRVVDKAPL